MKIRQHFIDSGSGTEAQVFANGKYYGEATPIGAIKLIFYVNSIQGEKINPDIFLFMPFHPKKYIFIYYLYTRRTHTIVIIWSF